MCYSVTCFKSKFPLLVQILCQVWNAFKILQVQLHCFRLNFHSNYDCIFSEDLNLQTNLLKVADLNRIINKFHKVNKEEFKIPIHVHIYILFSVLEMNKYGSLNILLVPFKNIFKFIKHFKQPQLLKIKVQKSKLQLLRKNI